MSQARLNTLLNEQLNFLRMSAESFDKGFLHEAKRLATTLRVLLHDTSQSHSLLGQLSLKTMGFVDTCLDLNERSIIPHNGIVMIHLTGTNAKYLAPLSNTPLGTAYTKDFNTWWNKLVLAKNKNDGYSRKNLVLQYANKEGGAHVDPTLDAKFNSLSDGTYLNTNFVTERGEFPIEDAPAFAIRQISFEVLASLDQRQPPNNRKFSF